MRRITVILLFSAALRVNGQTMVCPANPAPGGSCEQFHYHVQPYDPDTRQFVTLVGTNQYASQQACENARDARARQNAAVVDYVKRVKTQQYDADRLGPCHCDLSFNSASATYLTEAQRLGERRTAENLRRKVRAKLLDFDLPADSELITGLWLVAPSNAMLAGPRLTQVPAGPGAVADYRPADLRLPRAAQNGPSTASIDLPLAEIAASAASPHPAPLPTVTPAPTSPIRETTVKVDTMPSQPDVTEPAKTITATTAETPQPATTDFVAAKPASPDPSTPAQASTVQESISAEDSADAFIRHEAQRIQNVVNAITDPPDDTGERVIEACTQRTQALSNLRSLILGSGARSRIAQMARNAAPDAERLQLVTKLFGSEIAAHWMPKVTTDVLIAPRPSIDASAEKVLRDSSGQFTDGDKKRALYMLLTGDPITEEQQLWLVPVVEGFLQ